MLVDKRFCIWMRIELDLNAIKWIRINPNDDDFSVGRNVGWVYAQHYIDVVMGSMASQITSLTIVYLTVYSGAGHRKHQSSASLAFVWGIHRGEFPVQMASDAENVSLWWRHHEYLLH